MNDREQTALQMIQAQADDMIDRAHRHYRGPFRLGIPACVWRRANLPMVATVTTKQGNRARCIPVPGVEFQSYIETRTVLDVVCDGLLADMEAMQ
jgi:hypothetical protein